MQVKQAVMSAIIELCKSSSINLTYGDGEKLAKLVEEKLKSPNKQSDKSCSNCCRVLVSPECGSCGENNNWQMWVEQD